VDPEDPAGEEDPFGVLPDDGEGPAQYDDPAQHDDPAQYDDPARYDDSGDYGDGYGDGDGEGYDDTGEPLPATRIEGWRRRSATGAILTGIALGLQEVFEPKRDQPSIVVQTSGDPPSDLPVEADFEFRRPRQSVVNIRPWLLQGDSADAPADEEPPEKEAGPE
jgi:hypothetical protein